MKDASMSLGIYFEIKDAELYGGEGTTGYAATIVEIYKRKRHPERQRADGWSRVPGAGAGSK